MSRALRGSGGRDPLRVVVAGGGIAALETLIGLRSTGGTELELTLVAPKADIVHRTLDVGEPFGLGHPRRHALEAIARDVGAVLCPGKLARVRPDDHLAVLASGAEVAYDALVVAIGAQPLAPSFDAALRTVAAGRARSVAIVVEPAAAWPLPGYELALMMSAWGRAARRGGVAVALVTAEARPLEAFGPSASEAVAELLELAGVTLLTGVRLGPTDQLPADRSVSLPAATGPAVGGLPHDGGGFLPVDDHGRVDGAAHVYGAGDATAGLLKQAGLAAQQAEVVVEHLAAACGAGVAPRSYRPVLRGLLGTEEGPRYLRAELDDVDGTSAYSTRPLWWPPGRLASIWLSAYLARRDAARQPATRRLSTGGVAARSRFRAG